MARVGGVVTALLLSCCTLAVPAGASTAAASGGYDFFETQTRSTEPVRWNPCAPIRFRINANGLAGPSSVRRVRAAVAEAAAVTGIRFVYAGRTRFVPDDRAHPVPARLDADVIITWAHRGSGPRRSALLPAKAGLAGVGGYAARSTNKGFRIARSGFVVFDASRIFRMSAHKQYVAALHELGHLLGLGHVGDRRQIMYGAVLARGPGHYATGDRRGLRRLGRAAGCLAPAPAPHRPKLVPVDGRIRITVPAVTSVSGPVTYSLRSPELDGMVVSSSTPQFSLRLADLARRRAGDGVRFVVRASNRIGYATSAPSAFAVPAVVLTAPPGLAATPTSLDVVMPRAVLAGTSVDVSDQLLIRTDGTVCAYKESGGSFPTSALYEHMLYFGSRVDRYEVTGSVIVEGPGLAPASYGVGGSYPTSTPVDPEVETPVPADPPA